MAGPDRHPVHGQYAELVDHAGGVVVAPGARAGHHDDQVRPGRGGPDGRADPVRVVRLDARRPGLASGLAGLGDQHHRVGVEDLAVLGRTAHRNDLVAGGDHRHPRAPVHDDLGRPGRRGRGDVDRTQPVPLRKQQLAGTDVLADRAHVLVRRDRGHDLGGHALVVDVLPHHHGVEPVGDRVPGVHHDVLVRWQIQRRGRRGPVGLLGADRDPVHRRQVARWGRAGRPHRLRGHPTERVGDRHRDRVEALGTAGGDGRRRATRRRRRQRVRR